MFRSDLIRAGAMVLALGCAATAGAQSTELDALRARIEQQAAELAQLRAVVDRLSAATPAPASVTAAPTSAPAPAAPKSVEAGTGSIRFNGLLQGWFASADSGFQDTFRVRRAELKFSGDLGKRAGWTVMIDPSKSLGFGTSGALNQATRPLQDAFITFGAPSRVTLVAGQFKVPISREGLESSAALDTVERALAFSDRARGGAYGDIRDVGVALRRNVDRYDLTVGIFNGTGESQNDVDANERKAVSGRFNLRVPGVAGLQLGASGAWGSNRGATRRDRAGIDVLYVRGPWKLKSEIAAGRDGALERFGFYGHAGYRLTPRLELVGRLDQWDPDTHGDATAAAVRERDYIAGTNFSVTESLRLQANLVRKTYAGEVVRDRNLLLINLQTSW